MKKVKLNPSIESPTWGDLQKLAERVMELLGGPRGAAQQLNGRSFYTLVVLDSLMLDEAKADAPIFGKRRLT